MKAVATPELTTTSSITVIQQLRHPDVLFVSGLYLLPNRRTLQARRIIKRDFIGQICAKGFTFK